MRGREGDRERESVTNIERKRRKNSIVSIPLRILFDIVLMFATAAAVYNIVVVCSLNIFLSFITCLYLCQSQFEVISSCSKCSIFLFILFYCCTISNWTKTTTSFWLLRPNSHDEWTNLFGPYFIIFLSNCCLSRNPWKIQNSAESIKEVFCIQNYVRGKVRE